MSVEWCRLAQLTLIRLHLLGPLLAFGLVAASSPRAAAQNQGLVVRDGTLGNAPAGVVAPGPDDLGTADYLIRADLGEQHGGNLFHSFERFSIGSGERTTFSADGAPNPGAIENVISRVTGTSRSEIDGTLHSTIPGADVWLLNPHGVVFGAGAQLDVPGSFHASTGNYVGFGADGLERFYSDPSRASVRRSGEPSGSFAVRGNGGIPPEPDGWLRASLDLEDHPEPVARSVSLAEPSGAPLLALRTCQASSAQLQ